MALLNKVFLKNPKKSNFDLSRKNRTTMAPGVLYPVLVEELLPGDTIDLSMKSLIKTYPLLAPMMGSFKMQMDVYFVPTRLYTPDLRLNRPEFDPTSVDFPVIRILDTPVGEAAVDLGKSGTSSYTRLNFSLSSSNILNYLGFPTGFCPTQSLGETACDYTSGKEFNAIPFLGYYDIFRNYYANTQEESYFAFGSGNTYADFAHLKVGSNGLFEYNLNSLNNFYEVLERYMLMGNRLVNNFVNDSSVSLFPNFFTISKSNGCPNPNIFTDLGGLCVKTYSSDFLTTWLNTASYETIISNAKINIDSDSFTVNQMRTGNKLMKYLERSLVSGGRFGDWIEAQFGVKTDYKLDIPELIGSTSTDVIFDDVVQTTGYDTDSALGSLGGRGKGFLNGRPHHFNCSENGYLMVIASITPRVDYYQGVKPYLTKTNYQDLFSPQLDNLGFETLSKATLSALPKIYVSEDGVGNQTVNVTSSYDPFSQSVGYQAAWQEYMTSVNELHGDFTETLNYWTISRNFTIGNPLGETDFGTPTFGGTYDDPCYPTSYIFPQNYSYCFSDTSDTAENFLVQFSFDFFARRCISKQIMPTL